MDILIFMVVFTFIIGAIIGSFLNVVALRGLSGESIVFPPSKCPHCGNRIKPWHNIPILSYLLLRGKCAYCKAPISIQYPIVELLTALTMVGILIKFGPAISSLFMFICCCALIVMSATDFKEKVICAGHAIFLTLVGIIYNSYLTFIVFKTYGNFQMNFENILALPITISILGLIGCALLMEILSLSGNLFVGKRAFGVGDTFIAAALGSCFGFKNFLVIIILSIAIQVAIVIPSFFKKLALKKDFNTIISLVLFIIAAVGFTLANNSELFENFALCIAASAILLLIGLYTCWRVIKGMKEDGDLTVLPFGPAMAIATFIFLFAIV